TDARFAACIARAAQGKIHSKRRRISGRSRGQTYMEKRSRIDANAVVDVRLPADRLAIERLPTHEYVVGRLALHNPRQFVAKVLGRNQTLFGARLAGSGSPALRADPFAEIAVAKLLEAAAAGAGFLAKAMIIDERRESAAHAIPDVPDERRLVEQPAMAVEELVRQPRTKIHDLRLFGREQLA